MIYLCYLASGSAKRFGENKLLYPVNGKPLYLYGLEVLHELCKHNDCRLITVSRYNEILSKAAEYGTAINCPESVDGISFTIRAALSCCEDIKPDDRILFMAADQPFIKQETVQKLIDSADKLASNENSQLPVAACAACGDVEGNPVMFSSFLCEKLEKLTGDRGGKSVLKNYPGRMLRVECTARELEDIDYIEDIKKTSD